MKTQKERIIAYIKEFGSITTAQAFTDLGVSRLSARVAELKDDGFVFEDSWETAKNRYGETVTFKKFTLKGEAK